ncbi:hypothetical protein EUGRSUZ_J01253 [Eucalyptus grandis]|uniref:Non-haem dioxygenase N-terminal domain-containing protein n=3 Tax=Eucalyptus grandis TaxID=71139 RepID=A0A059AEI0_EUCGR|nr:hypothetical protein EUGRSUZ_J01256 [Eucalyptus grandis]KAK3409147.1 hypothetical protein EUGRSUZ_J01253 [Eucalyptus grandis]
MEVPVIDLSPYLEISPALSSSRPEEVADQLGASLMGLCGEVSRILRETGALMVKDPRCSALDNDRFIDMMEKYFDAPPHFKRFQERPHSHYQVGVTPEGIEVPKSLVDEEIQEKLKAMPEEVRPAIPKGPDLKWRYMWRVGPQPSNTRFQELNSEPVIPDGFPEWKETMDAWGYKMKSAVEGPLLLAPTGSNLRQYGQEGTVFAGYHYDINFLTIHGRSRFPGLNIWLRNGQKVEVKVPVGCLLIQTGKQIEWLTAGDCIAGMHEVVVTSRTMDAVAAASKQNRSLWRVSSTLFAHIATDAMLKPLGHFADSPLASKYPPMCAGEFIKQELAVINLKGSKGES